MTQATRIIFLGCSLLPMCVQGNFLAVSDEDLRPPPEKVMTSLRIVERSLDDIYERAIGERSALDSQCFGAIEKALWQTFQALPKNEAGRLEPRAVRFIAHSYFAKTHGWLLEGLEPHGIQANASEVHKASILQERAPALVEAMIENHQSGRGLSLDDVVMMIAMLERLVFNESLALLEAAYVLHGLSVADRIDGAQLHEVLLTYLMAFSEGDYAADLLADPSAYMNPKTRNVRKIHLDALKDDAVMNFDYAMQRSSNPFMPPRYSFGAASTILTAMVRDHAARAESGCALMKEHLMSLDTEGSGRVPLDVFYGQPNHSTYMFIETVDYLKSIGALDETDDGIPEVRIANYIAGPSNCLAHSAFYSVCCLHDCEGLMNELEAEVQAPVASPERLLLLVSDLSSPHRIPERLVEKLHQISARHNGDVPLHGRLFAQWLHFAFPNECAYPQVVASTAPSPGDWNSDARAISSMEERELHIEAGNGSVRRPEALEALLTQWTDDEVLMFYEPARRWQDILGGRQCAAVLSLLVLAFRAAEALRTAVTHHRGGDDAKKGLGCFV